MQRRLITELPSRLINHWQVQGGDICVLPVGSVEVLGPHLPLGGRLFVAEAFAKLLAGAADGLYLPAVPLTPTFGTGNLRSEAKWLYLQSLTYNGSGIMRTGLLDHADRRMRQNGASLTIPS